MDYDKSYKISVIITIFNGEKTIAETLSSVLVSIKNARCASNKVFDSEIILVDDKSTDDSIEIVRNFISHSEEHCKFRILRNESNKGVAASRYEGLLCARGNMIHILDQDDKVNPSFYIEVINNILEGTAIVVNGVVIDDYGKIIKKSTSHTIIRVCKSTMTRRLNRLETYVYGGNPITSPGSVVFSRSSIDDILFFYEVITNLERCDGVDDGLLYPFLVNRGMRFRYIKRKLFAYRVHISNQSSQLGRRKMHANSRKLMDELFRHELIKKWQYDGMVARNTLMYGFYSRKGLKKLIWLLVNVDTVIKKIIFMYI